MKYEIEIENDEDIVKLFLLRHRNYITERPAYYTDQPELLPAIDVLLSYVMLPDEFAKLVDNPLCRV